MPDTIELTINGNSKQFAHGKTISDLLQKLQLNPQQVAVEVNLELVPRERHAEYSLVAGDQVEVVTLVGGG